MQALATAVLWIVGLFYGYGALVHVLNMAGLGGFDWSEAPLRWQVLDVVYLALDVVVCAGFLARRRGRAAWRPAVGAFYLAATSQILLYTVGRSWVTDVPEAFAITPEQDAYLSLLVAFHVVTLVLVSLALAATNRPGTRPPAAGETPRRTPGAA